MQNYDKNRKEMISDMLDVFGYIFCESCKVSNSFKFHCHHIFFRSEMPNHPMLHHKDNLIIVCNQCHDKFHADKTVRNPLVEQRGLVKLFRDNKTF